MASRSRCARVCNMMPMSRNATFSRARTPSAKSALSAGSSPAGVGPAEAPRTAGRISDSATDQAEAIQSAGTPASAVCRLMRMRSASQASS